MGFAPIGTSLGSYLRDRLAAALRRRALKREVLRELFAGRPVIERIRLDRVDRETVFTVFYRNGLMLKVDERGLDGFDRGSDLRETPDESASASAPALAGTAAGRDAAADAPVEERRRALAPLLRRLVLESLLRHITSPRVEPRQRERAAQAASRIWMAAERERKVPAPTPPGPLPLASPRMHAPSA